MSSTRATQAAIELLDAAPVEVEAATSAAVQQCVADLSRPEALGLPPGTKVEVRETHISIVFLTPQRAYKVKKPVALWGLLDYTTLEQRIRLCEEEVRLNRRLAAPIYLGTVPIVREEGRLRVWHGPQRPPDTKTIVDAAVVMVRVPDFASWRTRIASGWMAPREISDLAVLLADFHKLHRVQGAAAARALPMGFARVVGQNVRATRVAVPRTFPASVHQGLVTRLARRLQRAKRRLKQRAGEGRVVDGHGDLRLDHVVRHQGRVTVLDCIEFTERLRHIDPLSDAAFLSVDLHSQGRSDLSRHFEQAYLERSGDLDGSALLPLFRAYRAHVRAKVNELQSNDARRTLPERAAFGRASWRWLALAWHFSRAGAPQPLVVLHGPSGTGKSVLARSLAPWLGADVIASDVLRKELVGMKPTDRPRPQDIDRLYGPDMHARTYEALHLRALRMLGSGKPVVLDATYLKASTREDARRMAAGVGVPCVLVDLRCDPAEIRRRLDERVARGDDASDADVRVYEHQMASLEPLGPADERGLVIHDLETPHERTLLAIAEAVEAQVDARKEALGSDPRPSS